jgi:plasmid segregation protein ParM
MSYIIGIDHGNKAIKSIVNQYNSGFTVSNTMPITKERLLEFEGKYYSILGERFPVMLDKTVNDNFFILSLPAIAEVLEKKYQGVNKGEIILACGLPIMYYGKQKDKFREYFLRDNISFTFGEKRYEVSIKDAYVYPQGYAAIMPHFTHYKDVSRLNVVDIGGYTIDVFIVEKGLLNIKSCISLTTGIVTLLNSIKQDILSLGIEIHEEQIEDTILGENISFFQNENIKSLIEEKTQIYVEELLDKLKEYGFEMKINPTIFVGGGSMLLQKYIENSPKIGYMEVLDSFANVKGFELLAKQAVSRDR